MVLLEALWDDVLAGPQPERGLGRLRKLSTAKPLTVGKDGEAGQGSKTFARSLSMPGTPSSPATPTTPGTPVSARKENVWRSVFHPGSNLATRKIGAEMFDKPAQPNSPTVYDWLYSDDTRSKHF